MVNRNYILRLRFLWLPMFISNALIWDIYFSWFVCNHSVSAFSASEVTSSNVLFLVFLLYLSFVCFFLLELSSNSKSVFSHNSSVCYFMYLLKFVHFLQSQCDSILAYFNNVLCKQRKELRRDPFHYYCFRRIHLFCFVCGYNFVSFLNVSNCRFRSTKTSLLLTKFILKIFFFYWKQNVFHPLTEFLHDCSPISLSFSVSNSALGGFNGLYYCKWKWMSTSTRFGSANVEIVSSYSILLIKRIEMVKLKTAWNKTQNQK